MRKYLLIRCSIILEREHLKMKLTDSEQLQRKQQEDLEKLVKQVKILEHRNEIIGEEQKE